jgi:hypothetical protein
MNNRSLLFGAVLVVASLSNTNWAHAQDSAALPARPDAIPGRPANSDNSQILTDEDIQLFRKDVRSITKHFARCYRVRETAHFFSNRVSAWFDDRDLQVSSQMPLISP